MPPPAQDEPFTLEQLKKVWEKFSDLHRNQQLEFQLLSQPMECNGNTITLQLNNPIQETILQSLRSDLSVFLRKELKNQSIQIESVMMEGETKKMIYTNREKLDHLTEKYPALLELKERFGLDPDF